MRARMAPRRLVVLGHPIRHSLSPVLQLGALSAAGLDVRYEAVDVTPDALSDVLGALGRDGAGGNVTMPHKAAVAAHGARLSDTAKRVGAVNTFWHDDGQLVGHNTDVDGVMATIRTLCPDGIAGARVVLLGAGGSAGAVLLALDMLGCHDITIAARTRERAATLLEQVSVDADVRHLAENNDETRQRAATRALIADAALVINATPIGLTDASMPIEPALLAPGTAVFDLVYRRGGTPWVRACLDRELRAEDGLRMLVEQGAAAFCCWFDREPSRQAMWDALGETRP